MNLLAYDFMHRALIAAALIGIIAPLIGIFGNDDQRPSPAHVNRTEETLKALGKSYEFHRYDGAGHGFFAAERPAYRAEQATDGWKKVYDFLDRTIGPRARAG